MRKAARRNKSSCSKAGSAVIGRVMTHSSGKTFLIFSFRNKSCRIGFCVSSCCLFFGRRHCGRSSHQFSSISVTALKQRRPRRACVNHCPLRSVVRDLAGNVVSADAVGRFTEFRAGGFSVHKAMPPDEHSDKSSQMGNPGRAQRTRGLPI
jgi:hypothetical protein